MVAQLPCRAWTMWSPVRLVASVTLVTFEAIVRGRTVDPVHQGSLCIAPGEGKQDAGSIPASSTSPQAARAVLALAAFLLVDPLMKFSARKPGSPMPGQGSMRRSSQHDGDECAKITLATEEQEPTGDRGTARPGW